MSVRQDLRVAVRRLLKDRASTAVAVVALGVGIGATNTFSRWQELGVRLALGAPPAHVSWLVLRRALGQLAAGVLAGLAGTVAFDRLFTDPTAPARLTDAITLVPVVLLVVAVATSACLVPARRAARLDPLLTIRSE